MQVVSFNQVLAATENLVPILISFYIGSLSDKFGRRRFMAFCFGCKVVASAANLLGGVFLEKMNRYPTFTLIHCFLHHFTLHYRWVWLAVYMPVQNISGGWMALILVTCSFIAENSSPRQN